MKPPARAISGHLIWSAEGGVWALWRVKPFAHCYGTVADRLIVHSRLRGLLIGLPRQSMLLSVCERLDPWDVVADMVDGINLGEHAAWAQVCEATAAALSRQALYRRRYYVAAELPDDQAAGAWRPVLRSAAFDVSSKFGLTPARLAPDELEARHRQADALEAALMTHVPLERPAAGEIRWLYARALRRATEPALDETWEPPPTTSRRGSAVLAPLLDAVVKEGGYRDDPGRPRHHRYVRIDAGEHTSFVSCLAVADMPHEFTFPGGGGEWLHHLDDIPIPIDWCVRIRSVPNAEAQLKLRRQHRQLIGQIDEYDGEVSGAPPSLAEAITAVDDQRTSLSTNPTEPELQATIIFSVAADDLTALEDHATAITALFEPHEYGIFRPTGGQTALLRSMLPGTNPAPVCRDYTQFLLPGDLAAGAPFCGTKLGDPRGLLLGFCLDSGTPAPVLLDPTYGPTVGRSASLAAIGALGSGKSYLLKRLCWDTIARGGQVVTIDRTAIGEYQRFAQTVPGRTQIVQLRPGSDVCLDPLRCFAGDDRVNVTLGFLSLLAGCSTHSEEGAALAEAVHTTADCPDARLGDVVDQLRRMATATQAPDTTARSLARRLDHYQRIGIGRLAFGHGNPVSLDADFIVFWVPHLALPDQNTLHSEHLVRQMLPEEVLGQALIYMLAAVARHAVFSNPGRFGAALYDEAWVLLGSPHGQRLVLEGIRDGRKHNGAIWLATQHPQDLGSGELVDLLGPRFVFHQARGAIGPATEFLGVPGSEDATEVLRRGLPTGRCLYRDMQDRIGLIDITPPVLAGPRAAADTTPRRATPTHATAEPREDREQGDMPLRRVNGGARSSQGRAETQHRTDRTPAGHGPRPRRTTPLAEALAAQSKQPR